MKGAKLSEKFNEMSWNYFVKNAVELNAGESTYQLKKKLLDSICLYNGSYEKLYEVLTNVDANKKPSIKRLLAWYVDQLKIKQLPSTINRENFATKVQIIIAGGLLSYFLLGKENGAGVIFGVDGGVILVIAFIVVTTIQGFIAYKIRQIHGRLRIAELMMELIQ